MNREQYDILHQTMIKQQKYITDQTAKLDLLEEKIIKLSNLIEALGRVIVEKTIVISNVDDKFKQIQLEINSLKDEQEA